ncbi:hypothetical protein [Thermocatellispora tengchongensis]|uniref:hypothetical protein n=1 Tax=Thermocatellispora tengchongensis TaxID=1073253 RepID=UPI0036428D0C
MSAQPPITAAPGTSLGAYLCSRAAASLEAARAVAVAIAVAAITAAMAGAVRPRCRTASRPARRRGRGRRAATAAASPASVGASATRPSWVTRTPPTRASVPRWAYTLPPVRARTEARVSAVPASTRITPAIGRPRRARGRSARPPSTAATSVRAACRAGMTAAMTAPAAPSTATRATWPHGTSNGPAVATPSRVRNGRPAPAAAMPSAAPARALSTPSTNPSASTIAPRCLPSPPWAATWPSSARRRRSPTANAGPASRATWSTIIETTSPARARTPPPVTPATLGTARGCMRTSGGSSITARERTTRPLALSGETASQSIGRGVSASQERVAVGPARPLPAAATITSARMGVPGSSTPTIRCGALPRMTSEPPRRTPCSSMAGVTATSPPAAGGRPRSSRNMPRVSGSRRSASTMVAGGYQRPAR